MATTELTAETSPKRYAMNVDAWESATKVVHRTLREVVSGVEAELEDMEDGEERTFVIRVNRMTDAEVDAMPEWMGP